MSNFNTNDEHDILTKMYNLMDENVNVAGKRELEALENKYPELYQMILEDEAIADGTAYFPNDREDFGTDI